MRIWYSFYFIVPILTRTVLSTVPKVFGTVSVFCAKHIWHVVIRLAQKTFGTLLHSSINYLAQFAQSLLTWISTIFRYQQVLVQHRIT
jgi:hypothetical protein